MRSPGISPPSNRVPMSASSARPMPLVSPHGGRLVRSIVEKPVDRVESCETRRCWRPTAGSAPRNVSLRKPAPQRRGKSILSICRRPSALCVPSRPLRLQVFTSGAVHALLALTLLWFTGTALAQSAALEWLAKMRQAVHQLDYEGRFVYQVGDRLDGLYVVHRMKDGHELERLVALDGEPKQIIRGEQGVACLEPRSRNISVIGNRSGIRNDLHDELKRIAEHYELILDDAERRTAGRAALRLEVRPRDRFRFGYRFDLDATTALPLRSILLDHEGNIRSQTLFVDLKVGRDITPIEKDLSALALTRVPPTAARVSMLPQPGWQFRGLPPGFRLVTEQPADDGSRHYVFTDGLASISLYVEPDDERLLNGYSRIGATEAYGTVRYGHQMVVVGEVPRATLTKIAEAAEPR
ncbi:MAG: hypothetical protein D6720_02735 [Gammaproteobacteria bacterium]|nr:MAG: hypothetical protein D6720_02735 [Gammaproteobacteria bacterium]